MLHFNYNRTSAFPQYAVQFSYFHKHGFYRIASNTVFLLLCTFTFRKISLYVFVVVYMNGRSYILSYTTRPSSLHHPPPSSSHKFSLPNWFNCFRLRCGPHTVLNRWNFLDAHRISTIRAHSYRRVLAFHRKTNEILEF